MTIDGGHAKNVRRWKPSSFEIEAHIPWPKTETVLQYTGSGDKALTKAGPARQFVEVRRIPGGADHASNEQNSNSVGLPRTNPQILPVATSVQPSAEIKKRIQLVVRTRLRPLCICSTATADSVTQSNSRQRTSPVR